MPSMSEPTGGHLCCPGRGAPNQQGRNWGHVVPSVQALKTTRIPTMWARAEGGIGWGHGVLEKPPEVERGPTTKRTGRVPTGSWPAITEQGPQEKG